MVFGFVIHHPSFRLFSSSLAIVEGLGIANVDYYWYLNQSGTYHVDGTDDKKEFQDTMVSPVLHVTLFLMDKLCK